MLGCGEWSVVVTIRGGGVVAATDVPVTTLALSLNLSASSEATVDLVDRRVCATLGETVRSWSHEVALYRDGELAMLGPIVGRRVTGDRLTWRVRDVSAWLGRWFVASDVSYAGVDAAALAALVVETAAARDSTVGITLDWKPVGVLVSRAYAAADAKYAIEALGEVVDAGGVWVVDGRTVRFGAAVDESSIGEAFGDAWASEPDVEEDGMAVATRVVVAGAKPSAGTQPYGSAVADAAVATYGLLEQRVQDDAATDSATAARLAGVAVARLAVPRRVVSSGDLSPGAPFVWRSVRPARRVWATVRGAGRFEGRIVGVNVRASGGVETISVDLEDVAGA